jgi:hypothetical protein
VKGDDSMMGIRAPSYQKSKKGILPNAFLQWEFNKKQ